MTARGIDTPPARFAGTPPMGGTRHKAALFVLAVAACARPLPSPSPSGAAAPPPAPAAVEVEAQFLETGHPAAAQPQQPQAAAQPPKKVPMPQVGGQPDFAFPKVAKKALPNGLKVYHARQGSLPVVSIRLLFRAGSAMDPADRPGLAVFVGEMLKAGTTTRSAAQLAEEVESLGANLSVVTDEDATEIALTCLAEHFDRVMELAADMVLHPVFPAEEIEILRTRELGRLALMASDPEWLAAREFARAAYGDHPYGHWDATAESIAAIGAAEVASFHAARYTAKNGILVVAGDIDKEKVWAAAAARFKGLTPGKEAKTPAMKVPATGGRKVVIVNRPGSVQTSFKIGRVALKRSSPDYPVLKVANYVLGGSASSRLFLRVREKESLAYSIGSGIAPKVEAGTWSVEGSTSTASTAQALASILDEMRRIGADEVPAGELADAKAYLTGSFPLAVETAAQVADRVADMALYKLKEGYWTAYPGAIGTVDAVEVKEAARKHIAAGPLLIVLVGDAEKIEGMLGGFDSIVTVEQ